MPGDTFGSRLLLIRHHRDLTQDDAAKACGLKSPTWNTWEHGASPRNMAEVVDAIHRGLNVDREWLMWGTKTGADMGRDATGWTSQILKVPALSGR